MPMPGTSQAMRSYNWAPEQQLASVNLTMDTQPTATDTVVLGAVTYTWRAAAVSTGEIAIGADLAAAKANLIAAINSGDAQNVVHPTVRISPFNTAHVAKLFAKVPGTGGNALASTETFTAVTNIFSAATFTLGSGTSGTGVAATSKVAIEDLAFEPTDTLYLPKLAKGILVGNRGSEIVVSRGTKWSVPDGPLNFEQFIQWMSMLTSNYTYVVIGGVANWVFTWALDQDPAPITRTMERRLSDGTNRIDNRFLYAMLSKLSFKTAQDKAVMFGVEGFARRVQTNTFTPSLVFPTIELVVSASESVYIDDTWGAIGGTAISQQIYASEISLESGYEPLTTSPGRSDLDFGVHMVNSDKITASAKLTALVTSGGLYTTEKTKAEAAALRAVRFKFEGSGGREIDIDVLMKHQAGSLFKVGAYNGTDIVQLDLASSTDDSNYLRVTVKCPSVTALI